MPSIRLIHLVLYHGALTLRILVTVGSALRMRPGLGWMLAFSAVFSFGANSLSSVLNQVCRGRGKWVEWWSYIQKGQKRRETRMGIDQ